MKVAVSAIDNTLDAEVDPRFGRCKYFLIIDTDSMNYKVIENDQQHATGGAGIHAAQMMANNRVDAVITGSIGPNAFRVLSAAGLKIFTGALGNIKETLTQFNNGELKESTQATVDAHHGSAWNNSQMKGGIRQ
jgi:predicted Fe-Mo cluster-binding NifX family protein